MNDEAGEWLAYAEENLRVATLTLESRLLNSCIHNAQQATEKALKTLCFTRGLPLKKTHSIRELRDDLAKAGTAIELSDDECDLLDSVYLPSKYPVASVLPRFYPDQRIAQQCLGIAERVLACARSSMPTTPVEPLDTDGMKR